MYVTIIKFLILTLELRYKDIKFIFKIEIHNTYYN